MGMWIEPVALTGDLIRLEPLSTDHREDLITAVSDGDLYQLWYTAIPAPEKMTQEIERRLGLMQAGRMMPYAVICKTLGKAVGMTTYMNIDQANRNVEIGATWYRKSVQRSALNTACKLLMLHHAFVNLNCIAVTFRTHVMNRQSRRAIERLGAKLDGILRSNMIVANGTLRDTAVYSIIAGEWPSVAANLKWQLEKNRA